MTFGLNFVITLGEKVKKAREDAGLTLEGLGEAIGKSKQAIYKIENNQFKSIDKIKSTLILLAKELNNDFGESWLTKYLNEAIPSKKEIIKETSPEEYFSLRNDGETTERQKEDALRLLELAQNKLRQMED